MLTEILKNDYEFIGIVTISPDREDDVISVEKVSDEFRKLMPPQISGYSVHDIIDTLIEGFVYEPDRRYVFNGTRRNVVLEKLKNHSVYSLGFRVFVDGSIRIARIANLPLHNESFGKPQYIVAIQLVDEGQGDIVETTFAADSLLSDYEAIFLVDTDEDRIESIRVNKEYDNMFDRATETRVYSERMIRTIEKNVAPEDREFALRRFSAEHVMKGLEDHPIESFSFKAVNKEGEREFYEAKFSRRFGPGKKGFILGIRNVVDEIRERKYDEMLTLSLANDFDCVMYLDIEHGYEERILLATEEFKRMLPDWSDAHDYEKRAQMFIDTVVMPRDRERLIEQTKMDVILNELRKKTAYFVNFRIMIDDEIRYYQIKFTADMKKNTARGIVIGFNDVNDTMREDFQKEEELAEAKAKAEKEIIRKTAELRERNKVLARINDEIVEMLADVVEMRDSGSDEHVIKVKAFSNILAKCVKDNLEEYALTDEDVELITSASVLHDIGKILIPDSVLLKPGKLTPEEFSIMESHCNKGCDILMRASRSWGDRYLKLALDICRYHHEKWDGNGYPNGLRGDNIPIAAQIVSVADCYDALTSMRVYDDIHEAEDAFDMILRGECGEYSDKLMKCLRMCREQFINALYNPQDVIEQYLGRNEKEDDSVLKDLDIILADDDSLSREVNREILEARGAKVTEAADGVEAVEKFREMSLVDAIIMDVHMPRMNGIEAIESIREREKDLADRVPIVALTADTSLSVIDKLIEAGADGSLDKPLDVNEFTRILLTSMRMRSAQMEEKLAETVKDANIDPLTKLRNRKAFRSMAAQIEDEIKSPFPPEFAIAVCDINNLKLVNDTRGHELGDVYIKNCCRIICEVFQHSPVFRVGGDEFMVILRGTDYENKEEVMKTLAERIATAEKYEDVLKGKASLAAGLGIFDKEKDISVDDVSRRADEAMYRNKKEMKERPLH